MYELISGGGGGGVQTMSDYRQGPGVENLQQSDFWVQFRGLDAFNNGDECFELQECESVQPAIKVFKDVNITTNYKVLTIQIIV